MGLCKCARKKVTTLFCFEHRVNVCEHCLIENHPKCVVQSYLQWLQDSDFDPNCALCGQSFDSTDADSVVRLLCLHLFHWDCIDRWGAARGAQTAPAGFRCAVCNDALFPKPNQQSAVVERLRRQLQAANWARHGLGLPLLADGAAKPSVHAAALHNHSVSHSTAVPIGDDLADDSHMMARKMPSSAHDDSLTAPTAAAADSDLVENKYKRRSAMEWLRRWLRSRSVVSVRRPYGDPLRGYRRLFCVLVLVIVGLVTLITLLTRVVPAASDQDAFLDPLANPNIRVAMDNGPFG